MAAMNPLRELLRHGQSYWLDNLTRGMIRSGELERRVREEGLRGVTSNPAIFNKAISSGHDYDEQIGALVREGLGVGAIYEELAVADIRDACDVLRPVWDESKGVDGYVSLEVSPYLAHDADATTEEACRLNARVDRPNVLIKIPGTAAAVPAIEACLYEGVNVNVTLLFSIESYEAVALAYMRALERRLAREREVET
jgi:transaldolase